MYAKTVWPRATKYGMVTHFGQESVSRGQSRPYPKVAGPQRPQNYLGPIPTSKRFDLNIPNLVRQHTWRSSVFLGGQPRHSLKRAGLQRPQTFEALRTSKWFWPRATKCGTATHVGQQHVSRGQSRPYPKGGRGPNVPNFGGLPTYGQTVWSKATKFGTIAHVA